MVVSRLRSAGRALPQRAQTEREAREFAVSSQPSAQRYPPQQKHNNSPRGAGSRPHTEQNKNKNSTHSRQPPARQHAAPATLRELVLLSLLNDTPACLRCVHRLRPTVCTLARTHAAVPPTLCCRSKHGGTSSQIEIMCKSPHESSSVCATVLGLRLAPGVSHPAMGRLSRHRPTACACLSSPSGLRPAVRHPALRVLACGLPQVPRPKRCGHSQPRGPFVSRRPRRYAGWRKNSPDGRADLTRGLVLRILCALHACGVPPFPPCCGVVTLHLLHSYGGNVIFRKLNRRFANLRGRPVRVPTWVACPHLGAGPRLPQLHRAARHAATHVSG